jgi:hypothetical protein
MHSYAELVHRGTIYTLRALEETHNEVTKILENSAPTSAVKSLQMIQLQKAVLAVGMFSMFDSRLQEHLGCEKGFRSAKDILNNAGKLKLLDLFVVFECGINVLKHGYGRSYDFLVSKYNELPFRIKLPDEDLFEEGDVSEISTLIDVDNQFVLDCAEVIELVSNEIRKERPECLL